MCILIFLKNSQLSKTMKSSTTASNVMAFYAHCVARNILQNNSNPTPSIDLLIVAMLFCVPVIVWNQSWYLFIYSSGLLFIIASRILFSLSVRVFDKKCLWYKILFLSNMSSHTSKLTRKISPAGFDYYLQDKILCLPYLLLAYVFMLLVQLENFWHKGRTCKKIRAVSFKEPPCKCWW